MTNHWHRLRGLLVAAKSEPERPIDRVKERRDQMLLDFIDEIREAAVSGNYRSADIEICHGRIETIDIDTADADEPLPFFKHPDTYILKVKM